MSEKANRYIDPLTDFGFKHFFANERNKEILLQFLKAVFEEKKQIEDVVFTPVAKDSQRDKDCSAEVLCKEKNGKQFTVTLRRIEEELFRKSSGKFVARFFRQVDKDQQESSGFPLKENYLLGLLDFSFGDCKDLYYREITLSKVDRKSNPAGRLGFVFLEIPEFHKTSKELGSELDKWFYLLKHLRHLDQIPKQLQEESFKKVFEAAEISALKPEEQAAYAAELKKRKSIFNIYNPDGAANAAMKKKAEEGHLDDQSKDSFLDVFKMGYETGFKDGMLEIVSELGSAW